MPGQSGASPTIGIAYLARGTEDMYFEAFRRFAASYLQYPAGMNHHLYILFKGFRGQEDLERAGGIFEGLSYTEIHLDDRGMDIGAYIAWAKIAGEEILGMFNTHSEILSAGWLRNFVDNLLLANVGMVGASGSYECLTPWNREFGRFPNVHLRSNAFFIRREFFVERFGSLVIRNKFDAFRFESGKASLTRIVMEEGRDVLVVGRNGRGYMPALWPLSETFRLGTQRNLVVADNQTRNYTEMHLEERKRWAQSTWGWYLQHPYRHNGPEA